MNAILTAAEAILRRHPAPALPMPELLERLRAEGPDRHLTDDRLRPLLEGYPTRFRVLDVWKGPWRPFRSHAPAARLGPDCWVAVVGDRTDPPDDGGVAGRMRETVRWLARRLDLRSRHEVTRWHRLVLAEEEARSALSQAA